VQAFIRSLLSNTLGPLLFLLYINDLYLAINSCETFHFADDTHLLHFNTSLKSLCNKINTDLKNLINWLNANLISLNTEKTEIIIFRSQRKLLDFQPFFKLAGVRIYPKSKVKYLGVNLDPHLKWNEHITELSGKLKRANGAIAKLRHYVPFEALNGIYYAIFGSQLRYACQLWGLHDSTLSHRVLTLQNNAMRLMTFTEPWKSASPIYLRLGVLKLFDLVEVLNIILVFQYLNFNLPDDLLKSFEFKQFTHTYDTRGRNINMLMLPDVSSNQYGSKSLSKLAASQWNSLQMSHNNIELTSLSLSSLKFLAKNHYLNSYR